VSAPDAQAQHRPVPLVVTPGLNGYRLAFVAGERFEVVAEYPTFQEAYAAHRLVTEHRS
jgi:hypothetical protein